MVAEKATGGCSDVLDAAEFVAAKLRWQLVLLCDTTLSRSARLFGAALMHDFDTRAGGCAWRSQGQRPKRQDSVPESVSAPQDRIGYQGRLGLDVRTVQLAARELERAGYITIERGRGRGHSNRYWPQFEKAAATPPFSAEKAGPTPPFSAEKAGPTPPFSGEKAVSDAVKGGLGPAQHLKDLNYKRPRTRFPDVAAVIDAAGLGEGDAAMLRAFRFDVEAQRLIAGTETAFIAIRSTAGPVLAALGVRLACGAR